MAWSERVNTASNISDEPSRHDCVDEKVLGRRFELDIDAVVQHAFAAWGNL